MYKTDEDELMILGRSVGDSSVGIGSMSFEIKTGIPNDKDTKEMLDGNIIDKRYKNYREFLLYNFAKIFWELHDNGDIRIDTNEPGGDDWDYKAKFGYRDFKKTKEYNEKLFSFSSDELREIIIKAFETGWDWRRAVEKERMSKQYADETMTRLVRRC